MASGLPAVATDVGGVKELATGDGLLLCPPQDAAALADAIDTALARRAEIDSAELAARARRRFGYDTISNTWSEIYERLSREGGD
jgi:glycosyltransferase involved in cell wall biosynthesis